MSLGWTDLEDGEELLTVAVPRRLYERLKTYGEPREIIAEALTTQEPHRRGIRIVSIAGGDMVNISLPLDRIQAFPKTSPSRPFQCMCSSGGYLDSCGTI